MAQLAVIFLNVLVPVFLLVGLGYLAGPRLGLESRTLSIFQISRAYSWIVRSLENFAMRTAFKIAFRPQTAESVKSFSERALASASTR